MKKLFSFLCLLVLGMSMSAWATTYQITQPNKCVLTRVENTNNFKVELIYTSPYTGTFYVNSVAFASIPSINGEHTIAATSCDETLGRYYGGWDVLKKPQGTIAFSYVSGTRYNITLSGTAIASNNCGAYDEDNYNDDVFNATWSSIPVEVYESDGTTPIELTDEGGSGDSGSGEEENVVHITVDGGTITRYNSNCENYYFRIEGTSEDGYYVRFVSNKGWSGTGDILWNVDPGSNNGVYYTRIEKNSTTLVNGTQVTSAMLYEDPADPFKFDLDVDFTASNGTIYRVEMTASYEYVTLTGGTFSNSNNYFDIFATNFQFESKSGTSYIMGDYDFSQCYGVVYNGTTYMSSTSTNYNHVSAVIKEDLTAENTYILYARVWGASQMRFFKVSYTSSIGYGSIDSNANRDIDMPNPEYTAIKRLGNNTLKLQAQNDTEVLPYDYLWFDFIVDNDAYANKYIPSGVYDIKSTGTNRVKPSYKQVVNASKSWYWLDESSMTHVNYSSYYGYEPYYFFCISGSIKIINPNMTETPLYMWVESRNSNNVRWRAEVFSEDEPLLYEVLTSSNNGTVSIGCMENHGYTEEGVESNTIGNYYYAGTDMRFTANPSNSSYIFDHWECNDETITDENNNVIRDDLYLTCAAAYIDGNNKINIKAVYNDPAVTPEVTLCENCNDVYYNTFKANYNNETVNVTYNRQFTASRWSTMCLPFNVNYATMKTFGMDGCVYEFKYATGNANVGSGVNLYFSNAKSIEAGKGYIVNADAKLAEKTSFVFSNVTVDVSKDLGEALNSKEAYDRLSNANGDGDKTKGDIELVGTLRNGTLIGSSTEGNTYMGLKENKIYYPNTSQGSTIWAYRGIFHSSKALDIKNMQKMRIIVDGEDRGELIIDADGEILNAGGDAPSRKFIRDGVLYIEREGVIYDAQGKRVEN